MCGGKLQQSKESNFTLFEGSSFPDINQSEVSELDWKFVEEYSVDDGTHD